MQTVLVVEDEPHIAEIARDYLEHAGFDVVTTGDGVEALAIVRDRRPDAVVLDLGVSRLDGLEVARRLRQPGGRPGRARDVDGGPLNVPIIMLTARVSEADRLRGLELGADDYITKPFSPRELVARVRAVLRRTAAASAQAGDRLERGNVTIDLARRRVTRGGDDVDLTATEFQLLVTLARQPGRVFTRGQLLDAVRGGEGEAFDRAIDAHVKNIRRKLEPDPHEPRYILTVYGVGYKLAES
jgi:two-component system alkaline phosphatase synthesis response regulator PhoP